MSSAREDKSIVTKMLLWALKMCFKNIIIVTFAKVVCGILQTIKLAQMKIGKMQTYKFINAIYNYEITFSTYNLLYSIL